MTARRFHGLGRITDTWPGLGIQHGHGHGYDTDTGMGMGMGMGTGINGWIKHWLEMGGVSRARRRGIHSSHILGCAGFTARRRHMTEKEIHLPFGDSDQPDASNQPRWLPSFLLQCMYVCHSDLAAHTHIPQGGIPLERQQKHLSVGRGNNYCVRTGRGPGVCLL
jgi:hypothetical protein